MVHALGGRSDRHEGAEKAELARCNSATIVSGSTEGSSATPRNRFGSWAMNAASSSFISRAICGAKDRSPATRGNASSHGTGTMTWISISLRSNRSIRAFRSVSDGFSLIAALIAGALPSCFSSASRNFVDEMCE
jgi:hypothetical protein